MIYLLLTKIIMFFGNYNRKLNDHVKRILDIISVLRNLIAVSSYFNSLNSNVDFSPIPKVALHPTFSEKFWNGSE